jgi:hypothetical protein
MPDRPFLPVYTVKSGDTKRGSRDKVLSYPLLFTHRKAYADTSRGEGNKI